MFVERRLYELEKRKAIRATVIAPVPWFPVHGRIFGRYGRMAAINREDRRHGIKIYRPRYPLLPKIGMSSAPWLMASAVGSTVRAAIDAHGPFDLIDAQYFYPDGVAASLIARRFDLPLLITALGSDINLIGRYRLPRKAMLKAAGEAAGNIAVSKALATSMLDLGMPEDKMHVFHNGVDLEYFCPGDVDRSRRELSLDGAVMLSVGVLKEAKGHDLAIRLAGEVPNARLMVIGSGPDRERLERLADSLGIGDRVRFTGALDQSALRTCYRAADALILMSRREGMPNVILESIACGTPVIASAVGGIPEILTDDAAGRLVAERSLTALKDAWTSLSSQRPDRESVRRHAENFSWDDTIEELSTLMARCAA